jgi:hypothetical protein
MARRLIITAGWLAAAVLAVLVGLLAVTVIGDGLTSPIARPLSQSEVERELAAQPATPSPSRYASQSPSPSATAGADPVSRRTRGGTVVARCDDGRARLIQMSPAPGFEVHDRDDDEGEFRSVSDNHDRIKISLDCDADGRAVINAAQERDDD